jgi:hypothetical protein
MVGLAAGPNNDLILRFLALKTSQTEKLLRIILSLETFCYYLNLSPTPKISLSVQPININC